MAMKDVKKIIVYHKSEKCFKCKNMVEKNSDGYFKCKCGYEWANLFIKRVPSKTFLLFKEFSEKEFCSDYGFALKSLLENNFNPQIQGILELLNDHEKRISEIENEPGREIKTLTGKIIKVGGRENGKI